MIPFSKPNFLSSHHNQTTNHCRPCDCTSYTAKQWGGIPPDTAPNIKSEHLQLIQLCILLFDVVEEVVHIKVLARDQLHEFRRVIAAAVLVDVLL